MQALMHMMAYDLARVSVCHQAHVRHAFLGRQIRYVCAPNLLWSAGNDLFRTSFEQVRMTAKAVMAVRRFVVSPCLHDQFMIYSQYLVK